MTRSLTTLAGLATFALLLSGCGQDRDDAGRGADSDASAAQIDAFPVTVDTAAGDLILDERPERIVSLSPSATESLFAIGSGDQVVAVDAYSTFPAEAPTTDLSGFEPNVEAIAGYDPDLVVVAEDSGEVMAALDALDIPVLLSPPPATLEEGYDAIAALGLATGHPDETAEVVSTMRAGVEEALSRAPRQAVRIYHELDETFYAASSHGFIGSVYAALGATNIADAADRDESGFPQLTEEAVIEADPELIVITDQVGYDAADVANRPGWENVTAVRNGNIVTVDADISSRWGPRLPRLISAVAEAMASPRATAG